MRINYKALTERFAPSDIEWRIGQAGKKSDGSIWAKVLAYVTARAIEDRLDEVVGAPAWKNEFQFVDGGVLCGISINTELGWVTKWDGSDPSDIEAFKGSISGAMKRAAVQWGIGRYLYDLGESWAEILKDKQEGAHYANCKIKAKDKEEWVQFYWRPPQLPPWATPSGTAQKVAAEHGLKTADKLPEQKASDTYKKAIAALSKAVREKNVEAVAGIVNLAETRKSEGKLTESEHKMLMAECTLSLKKIREVENQAA